jgi:hypothetical protein
MVWGDAPKAEAPKAAKTAKAAASTLTPEERSARAKAAAHKAWETMRARRAA